MSGPGVVSADRFWTLWGRRQLPSVCQRTSRTLARDILGFVLSFLWHLCGRFHSRETRQRFSSRIECLDETLNYFSCSFSGLDAAFWVFPSESVKDLNHSLSFLPCVRISTYLGGSQAKVRASDVEMCAGGRADWKEGSVTAVTLSPTPRPPPENSDTRPVSGGHLSHSPHSCHRDANQVVVATPHLAWWKWESGAASVWMLLGNATPHTQFSVRTGDWRAKRNTLAIETQTLCVTHNQVLY